MKKFLLLILSLVLSVSCLASCEQLNKLLGKISTTEKIPEVKVETLKDAQTASIENYEGKTFEVDAVFNVEAVLSHKDTDVDFENSANVELHTVVKADLQAEDTALLFVSFGYKISLDAPEFAPASVNEAFGEIEGSVEALVELKDLEDGSHEDSLYVSVDATTRNLLVSILGPLLKVEGKVFEDGVVLKIDITEDLAKKDEDEEKSARDIISEILEGDTIGSAVRKAKALVLEETKMEESADLKDIIMSLVDEEDKEMAEQVFDIIDGSLSTTAAVEGNQFALNVNGLLDLTEIEIEIYEGVKVNVGELVLQSVVKEFLTEEESKQDEPALEGEEPKDEEPEEEAPAKQFGLTKAQVRVSQKSLFDQDLFFAESRNSLAIELSIVDYDNVDFLYALNGSVSLNVVLRKSLSAPIAQYEEVVESTFNDLLANVFEIERA